MRALRVLSRPALVLQCCLVAAAVSSCVRQPPAEHRQAGGFDALASPDGHVISGRVMDPGKLLPEDARLLLGGKDRGGFARVPLQVRKDGSFSTPPLRPGTYVLEVHYPDRPHEQPKVAGFALVPLASKDVSGVTVLIRPNTAIVGSFRMDSDDPAAPWPPHIVVQAFLALEGEDLQAAVMADGATGGRFVLRNAFGPRVLRCGYTLAPGARWWPGRVLLNGVDITDVPTDFSEHDGAELEVWFTRHPSRVTGVVTDPEGRPVAHAWVLIFPQDAGLRQLWSESRDARQADADGKFGFPLLPGRYALRALPSSTFPNVSADKMAGWREARQQMPRYWSSGSASVALGDRETRTVTVVCEGCK